MEVSWTLEAFLRNVQEPSTCQALDAYTEAEQQAAPLHGTPSLDPPTSGRRLQDTPLHGICGGSPVTTGIGEPRGKQTPATSESDLRLTTRSAPRASSVA
uniref:Uncharacterized protein n=1 Tax=Parascaris univalens TaxID=6257 RepID=A0A915BRX0_PARUN